MNSNSDITEETEDIGDYKVKFIWKAKIDREKRHKIKNLCISVFKNSKAYGEIPNIGFVIEPKIKGNKPGLVKGSEILKTNSYQVHLNYERISAKSKQEVKRVIRHELVHLWDHNKHLRKQEVEVVNRLNEITQEMESEFEEIVEKLDKEKPVTLKLLRSYVTLWLHSVRSEGIALNLDKGISMEYEDKNEAYLGIREEAEEAAEHIRSQMSDNGNKKGPEKTSFEQKHEQSKLEEIKYGEDAHQVEQAIESLKIIIYEAEREHSIGKHVVHSIRLSTNMTINEIAELGPRQLIKNYEKAEKKYKHDHDPVISLNSGRGTIDYNRMITRLRNLFDQFPHESRN